MNVVVTHGFEPNYTLGFVRGLAANNVPLVVMSADDTAERFTSSGIANINIRGAQSEGRSYSRKIVGLSRYYLRLLWQIFRHRGGTVHFTGIFRNELILVEGIILNLSLRFLSRRYLYTAHNILPHNRRNSAFFRFIYLIIYRIPDVVLVHTEEGARLLKEQFGVPVNKIKVISIGLNEEVPVTPLSRQEARHMLGYTNEDRTILFFGRIDEYKGLHLLLEAFDGLEIKNSKLLVAGSLRNAPYASMITAKIGASARKADIRIDFRIVPNEEIEGLFKAADVLCLPYLHITQSGILFLSARFGTPVVCTNVGSLSDYVTPESGLVAQSNDSVGIKAALEQFFANPDRFDREQIRQAGNRYRWDWICHDLVPFYEQCQLSGHS